MNFIEQLRTLDPRDIGRWPLAVRGSSSDLLFMVLVGLRAGTCSSGTTTAPCCRKKSRTSRTCAPIRDQAAARREPGSVQGAAGGNGAQLRRHVAAVAGQNRSAESAGRYFADRSGRGPQEKLFQPAPESSKGFYAELPIHIRLGGQLPPVRRVLERHRRTAAHRDAARHLNYRRWMPQEATTTIW